MSIENLIIWEDRFFANIALEDAERSLKQSKREHETCTANYLNTFSQKDTGKTLAARLKMKASVATLHRKQREFVVAEQGQNKVRQVTLAQ